MGAISGDVNSASIHAADAADLTSRPVAALKSGDRAFVVSGIDTAQGPLFYYLSTGAQTVDGVGVIATASGVGRWLSEALYPSGSGDLSLYDAPAADVAIGNGANANLYTSAALTAPADGFMDVQVDVSAFSGANAANLQFQILPVINGVAGAAIGAFGLFSYAVANQVNAGTSRARVAVIAGQTFAVRLACTSSAAGASIAPTTRPLDNQLHASIKFSRA